MQVMCIYSEWESTGWWGRVIDAFNEMRGRPFPHPTYGEICTVVGEKEVGYYDLKEYPESNWDKEGFIPIQEESQEEKEEVVYETEQKSEAYA